MNNFFIFRLILIGLFVCSISAVHARDRKEVLPIAPALESKKLERKLYGDVKFFFGNQAHPAVSKSLSINTATRKTPLFRTEDHVSCNRVFATVLVELERQAKEKGANAVINIVSYNKGIEFSSPSDFECISGMAMNSLTLRGEFVLIKDKE